MTRVDMHPEITTIGQCPHERHRHGWWCGRCLRAMVPGVVVTQCAGDKWIASWRSFGGYGPNAIHALQSCIEAARMDGAL